MNILFVLIPFALILAIVFLAAFIWAVRANQFEDLNTPAHRILIDEKNTSERRSS